MDNTILLWVGFNLFVILMLAIDLGLFHRKAHEVKFREAIIWSAVWIVLALVFNAGVWYYFGEVRAIEFLTGYIIEKSLSVDNIFVFVLIFAVDSIPAILAITNDPFIIYTSNVFAIMGLRSLYFALAGSLKYFTYLHYGLALILVFVGIKMLISEVYKLNPFVSLGIIGVILAGSIAASFIRKVKENINKT